MKKLQILEWKKSILIWLSIFLIVGVIVIASISVIDSSKLLSQFSGTNVTPINAASLWSPSSKNPNRANISAYSPRLDNVITNILSRWANLTPAAFTSYLGKLSEGITTLGRRSEYASDQTTKDIIAYLLYEINDAKTTVALGNNIFWDITSLIENTNTNTLENSTQTTATNTNTNTTTANITTTVAAVSTTNVTAATVWGWEQYSPTTNYINGQKFMYKWATITASSPGIGTSSTKAHPSCDKNDIAVWNGSNIQIWSACNIGSSISGVWESSYWEYFQWTNNISDNCPTGYKIPTGGTNDLYSEFWTLYTSIRSAQRFGSCSQAEAHDRLTCALKIPYAGYQHWTNSQYYHQDKAAMYWSSTESQEESNILAANMRFIKGDQSFMSDFQRKTFQFPLRCMKN